MHINMRRYMNKAQKQQIIRTFLLTLGFHLLIRGAIDLWVEWQLRKEDRADEAEYQRLKQVSEEEWLEDDDDQPDDESDSEEQCRANHPAGKRLYSDEVIKKTEEVLFSDGVVYDADSGTYSGSDIDKLIAANDEPVTYGPTIPPLPRQRDKSFAPFLEEEDRE